jgi:Cell wall-active antibiotics response 4TMS YvqF
VVVRPIRALALTAVGTVAGFMAAAAFVKRAVPSRGDEESDELALVAVFDGIELKNRATSFRGGSVLAWYGGVALDLREATLAPGANLTVHTLFGGVAIRVPPDWHVESNLQALAGGAEVRPGAESPDAPTLTIDGRALFGGIAVGARPPAGDDEDAPAT